MCYMYVVLRVSVRDVALFVVIGGPLDRHVQQESEGTEECRSVEHTAVSDHLFYRESKEWRLVDSENLRAWKLKVRRNLSRSYSLGSEHSPDALIATIIDTCDGQG